MKGSDFLLKFVLNKKNKPVKCWRIAPTLKKCSVYVGNSSARLGNLSGKYVICVLLIYLHTYTAGSKSTSAGSWFDPSAFVAVFVRKTSSIVARQRLTRVIFEWDDGEERKNWAIKTLSSENFVFKNLTSFGIGRFSRNVLLSIKCRVWIWRNGRLLFR